MTPLLEMFIPIFWVGGLVSAVMVVMAVIEGRMSGSSRPLLLLGMSAMVCWLQFFLVLRLAIRYGSRGPILPPRRSAIRRRWGLCCRDGFQWGFLPAFGLALLGSLKSSFERPKLVEWLVSQ